jgi:hypothetical protein
MLIRVPLTLMPVILCLQMLHWIALETLVIQEKKVLTGSISEDLVEATHESAQIRRSHEPTKEVGSVDNVTQQDGLELGRGFHQFS